MALYQSFLSMKWQWTYGPTLLPLNNHFHTSEACLRMHCIDPQALVFMFHAGSLNRPTIHEQ